MVCLKVAKYGYYGGDVDSVRKARVDDVVSILQYESFLSDYEEEFMGANRDNS